MSSSQKNQSIASEVIAASIGGMISASALYPLEVIKTKMQASPPTNSSSPGSGVTDRAETDSQDREGDDEGEGMNSASSTTVPVTSMELTKQMYKEGGVMAFYDGIATSAFQSATEKALYFFAYTTLKNLHTTVSGQKRIGAGSNLVLGCMAEWAHLPITLPIDCLTTAIQTKSPSSNQTAFAILSSLLSQKGFKGMYKGIQAYTILCLKPAIQYTVFEQVKYFYLKSQENAASSRNKKRSYSLTSSQAFLLGMIARAIATVLVFPYLRAKVMLQSSTKDSTDTVGEEKQAKAVSIPAMLVALWNKEGLSGLFQGLGPELTRGVFSTALMMMVKERLADTVESLMNGH